MKNPLVALDDIILDQFEKVNRRAVKKGKNKYDLANMCYKLFGLGMGVFGAGLMVAAPNPGGLLFGGVYAYGGFLEAQKQIRKNAELEREEYELLTNSGAAKPRKSNLMRPVILGIMGGISAAVIAYTEEKIGPLEVALLGGCAAHSIEIAADYFRSTTLVPPATKKFSEKIAGLYKKGVEKVKDALAPKPVPVPVRANRNYPTPLGIW